MCSVYKSSRDNAISRKPGTRCPFFTFPPPFFTFPPPSLDVDGIIHRPRSGRRNRVGLGDGSLSGFLDQRGDENGTLAFEVLHRRMLEEAGPAGRGRAEGTGTEEIFIVPLRFGTVGGGPMSVRLHDQGFLVRLGRRWITADRSVSGFDVRFQAGGLRVRFSAQPTLERLLSEGFGSPVRVDGKVMFAPCLVIGEPKRACVV